MPISRRRKKPARRTRARSRSATRAHDARITATTLRSLIEEGPSEAVLEGFTRALEAGARGDLVECMAQELSGGFVVESPRRFVLQDLVDQEGVAPSWAYSRWCADLAYRSMLLRQDPRTDEAVRLVMATLYPHRALQLIDDEVGLNVFGTQLAGGDAVVEDLSVYEFGGLAHYLEAEAGKGLLGRTDRIREWASAEMGIYRVHGLRGCRIVLEDLVDGQTVDVLNVGALSGRDAPALLGRVVPISSEPGLMFVSRPIGVDLGTAARIAESIRGGQPLEWLFALSTALDDEDVSEGFHATGCTPFTSDLPFPPIVAGRPVNRESEAGRIRDLRARGHCADVANAVAVLETGLIAADISDTAAAAVSPHVMAALATPGVYEAALAECVGCDTAQAWRVLAGVVPEHGAARLLALAQRADSAEPAGFPGPGEM